MEDADIQTPGAAPDGADTAPAGDAERASLRAERDELHDRLLRTKAEYDNFRKRIERERREQADQAVVDILLDVLSVVDDFDRALKAETSDVVAYRKGLELIYTKLHDLLRRQGVQPLESLGADFDPNHHQAVAYEESPSHRDGEVIGEMQRGYMIRDRLLRAAMVKVAKA